MTYESKAGQHIRECAEAIIALADESKSAVTTKFNDIELTAWPGDTVDKIVNFYDSESDTRHQKWLASPEYAEQQRQYEEDQRRKDAALKGALLTAPGTLTLRDPELWASWVAKNTDPYGSGVVRYADKWARLMEARISNGDTLENCANDASHIADDEGITGFMFGAAVAMLAKCWIHGEALRRWHNLKTQIGTEGEKANESGGVLNPALLTIG